MCMFPASMQSWQACIPQRMLPPHACIHPTLTPNLPAWSVSPRLPLIRVLDLPAVPAFQCMYSAFRPSSSTAASSAPPLSNNTGISIRIYTPCEFCKLMLLTVQGGDLLPQPAPQLLPQLQRCQARAASSMAPPRGPAASSMRRQERRRLPRPTSLPQSRPLKGATLCISTSWDTACCDIGLTVSEVPRRQLQPLPAAAARYTGAWGLPQARIVGGWSGKHYGPGPATRRRGFQRCPGDAHWTSFQLCLTHKRPNSGKGLVSQQPGCCKPARTWLGW